MALTYDHFIVAQRVTQAATDNASLPAMVQEVEQQWGAPPQQVVADSGYFSLQNLKQSEQGGIAGSVPDRIRTWPAS